MSGKIGERQEWTLHPAYCFDLSPTYNIWVKITAAHLHVLRYEGAFAGKHPLAKLAR